MFMREVASWSLSHASLFLGDVGFHVVCVLLLEGVHVEAHVLIKLIDWMHIHQLFAYLHEFVQGAFSSEVVGIIPSRSK